jgi:hypothetical protein
LHGGGDKLLTNDSDGRDEAHGGRGRDVCYFSRGDVTRSCEVVKRARFASGTSSIAQDRSAAAFTGGR